MPTPSKTRKPKVGRPRAATKKPIASKAAAHAVLIGLAAEVARSGVAVVELAPTVQVDTPGIRSRRPQGFEPRGYAQPECFVAPVLRLLDGEARQHHGTCLWIEPDGSLRETTGTVGR